MQETRQARYLRQRAHAIEFLGGECTVCGTAKNLTFHHKDSSTKSFNISANLSLGWDKLVVELNKCELRCTDCHLDYICYADLTI